MTLASKSRTQSFALVLVLLAACGSDDKAPALAGDAGGTGGSAGDTTSGGSGGVGGRAGASGTGGAGGRAGTGSGGMSGSGGAGGMADASVDEEDAEMPQGGAPAPGEPRDGVNVFFSGHSAFGLIMPAMVDQIAAELGREHNYNLQMGIGSSLSLRLGGTGNEQDRDGRPRMFEVANEITNASTIGGEKYDTLVVTEALMLIQKLQYDDSIGQLRGFHDLLMQSDPNGRVFLFDTWESAEGGDFAAWVSSTRDMFVIWECLASAVNKDVDNAVQMLPGGVAFARGVEAAAAGDIPGVAPADMFAPDMHHPSLALGSYFLALVTYASLYNRDPSGAPTSFTTPQGMQAGFVSADGAAALQAIAWETVSEFYAMPPNATRTMAECRSAVSAFCEAPNCNDMIAERFAD
jgi:hypothetical protein